MLTCLKIVPETYHLYVAFMELEGVEILSGSQTNNNYILKNGVTKTWEWINQHEFELNYKWVDGRASAAGWTPVVRINEDMDLL